MMKPWGPLLCVLCALLALPSAAHAASQTAPQATHVPRTILAPLSLDESGDPMYTLVHQTAEIVLNYQGLKVEYFDPDGPYLDLTKRPDVRGVLSWLPAGVTLKNPEKYWGFMAQALNTGKKAVIMGELFPLTPEGEESSVEDVNKVLQAMGLRTNGIWEPDTYTLKRVDNNKGYETPIPVPVPGLYQVQPIAKINPHIAFEQNDAGKAYFIGAATTPQGGFVSSGFALIEVGANEEQERRWIINPFKFFAEAFDTESLPKPDVNTLLGTRVYFSHIDGDGWRSATQLERYKGQLVSNADVLYQDILLKTPDLPTTVAPIAAEVDESWLGTPKTQKEVREIFALPNVEPASHTYSHPFSWDFYKPENFNPAQEETFARLYPRCGEKSDASSYGTTDHTHSGEKPEDIELDSYDLPRAFGCAPFTAKRETVDSINVIAKYAPEGKKPELVQWSGNTRPFEEVLKATEDAGYVHMNGGLTRFDNRFSSVAHVTPIGVQKGKYWQVYAPMSNENTYTNLWQGPYHGFRYLIQTLQNTGAPYRLKPINVYYHTYSAEKDASYNSLMMIFDYVRQQEIIPIAASDYARIAQGFFKAEMVPQGGKWLVKNRGSLQTIRFEKATFKRVDFASSYGVIGQRHFAGSLYVALDPEVAEPVIALTKHNRPDLNPEAIRPYVVSSRWPVSQFKASPNQLQITAQGFGTGELLLRMPTPKAVTLTTTQAGGTKQQTLTPAGEDNLVRVPLNQRQALTTAQFKVVW